MADSIGSLNVKLTATTGDLDKNLKAGAKLVDDFDRKVAATGKANPGKTLAADMRQADKAIQDATRSASRWSTGLVAGGTAAAVTMGAKAVKDLSVNVFDAVKDSIQLASNFEQVKLAFETMLGGAANADKMLNRIRDFATSSPLTFTESASSAKQLLSYGIAADQVIPTLRMLSDVSMGNKDVLGRMVYAYGQVSAATKLYGTELRQFTETGIPLVAELGKTLGVSTDQVRNLVEEGRVGFPELVKTFKRMTEDGGKFAGMTEKYGQTFAGQVERLTDSVEVLKREFGQALIEELGLKEATQDLGRFTDRVKTMVNDVRPAIRFVGDLGKGVAQLAYEGTRMAAIYGRVHLETIAAAIPELRGLPEKLHDIFKDIQDFKIDPRKVVDVSLMLTRGLFLGLNEFGTFIAEIGAKADEHLIKPFQDAAKALKQIADTTLAVVDKVHNLREKASSAAGLAVAVTNPLPLAEQLLMMRDDPIGRTLREQQAHQAEILKLTRPGEQLTPAELSDMYVNPALGAHFHERRAGQFALTGGASFIEPWDVGRVTDPRRWSKEWLQNLSRSGEKRLNDLEARMRAWGDQMAAAQEQEARDRERDRFQEITRNKLLAFSAVTGAAVTTGALSKSARELMAEKVAVPESKFGSEVGYHLPQAAEAGSQQAAVYAAMAIVGQGADTAEGLLRAIKDNTATENQKADELRTLLADVLAKLDATPFWIGGR